MSGYEALLGDLAAEQGALASVVAPLNAGELRTPTMADGWDIVDTLSHLAGFDEAATLSLTDPDAFVADLERMMAAGEDPVAGYTARGRAMAPVDVASWWRDGRRALLDAASAVDARARVPWYGPPMSAMSFITARLMETWAHGVDVFDTLAVVVPATERLRHVAHIGVGARGYSYAVRGLEVPHTPISVALVAPSGDTWQWGPVESTDHVTTDRMVSDRVEGGALDFCLVVTQRRHLDDTTLSITGPVAAEWMSFAQAFAGGPGAGRARASKS